VLKVKTSLFHFTDWWSVFCVGRACLW